jgi:urease accessory protein
MDSRALLAALQHADSFFPSGTASFSWGLEALRADGLVRTADDGTATW